MTRTERIIVVFVVSVVTLGCRDVFGQFVITTDPGTTGTIEEQDIFNSGCDTEYGIYLRTSGTVRVFIRPAGGSPVTLGPIFVEPEPSGLNDICYLQVLRVTGERLTHIQRIQTVDTNPPANGRLIVEIVQIDRKVDGTDGNLGENQCANWNPPGIDAWAIGNLDIQGTIYGEIVAESSSIGNVVAGRDIKAIRIESVFGNVAQVHAITGDIGPTPTNGNVYVAARLALGSIRAQRMWTDINLGIPSDLNNGALRNIETLATGGHFNGSITANLIDENFPFTPTFFVRGDLNANVMLRNYNAVPALQVVGSFPAGRTLSVGQGLASGRSMSFGTLGGQVILNAQDRATAHPWQGPVTANGNTIGTGSGFSQPYLAPYYELSSTSLGGGAIGHAPFHLHDEDCTPPNGYFGAPPGDNKLRLRWYGPLSWSSGDPVTVWYRVHPSQSWTDITNDFAFEINPSNPRELVLTPETPWDLDAITYRVIPTSNLKCAGVTGAPVVYSLDEYIVDIDF
ncbi:MAG: hypothetical protein ACKVU4_02565 [Phycisphaerales bacterium]